MIASIGTGLVLYSICTNKAPALIEKKSFVVWVRFSNRRQIPQFYWPKCSIS